MMMSQEILSKVIGVSRGTLWKYNKGLIDSKKIKDFFDKYTQEEIEYMCDYEKTKQTVYEFIERNKENHEMFDDMLYDFPEKIKIFLRTYI